MNSIFSSKNTPGEGDASPVKNKSKINSFIDNLVEAREVREKEMMGGTGISTALTDNEVRQLQEKLSSGVVAIDNGPSIIDTTIYDKRAPEPRIDNKELDIALDDINDITDLYKVLQSACSAHLITHRGDVSDVTVFVNNLKNFVEKQMEIIDESKRLN